MNDNVEMLPTPEWPDGHMDIFTEQDVSLGTEGLPDEVVATPFILALWCSTAKNSPRMGAVQARFVFGERENATDLTPDEAAYVEKVLEVFMRKVRAS